MSLTQVTFWSWLTTQEATNQIYCPPDLQVKNEEFAAELAKQVKENRLPAEVKLCEVNWADTDTKQPRILVQHTGGDTVAQLIQFLVGVDQMGNFTYVEEKVCLRPPKLPDVPRKKKSQSSKPGKVWPGLLIAGGVVSLILLVIAMGETGGGDGGGACCLVTGLLALVAGIAWNSSIDTKLKTWQEVEEWNKQADQEQRAWDEAVNSWYKDTLKAAQLARTDDVFGRFTLALTSTVKQVIKTLFEDRQAELRERTEKERTQKEIEEELERRKQEGFK